MFLGCYWLPLKMGQFVWQPYHTRSPHYQGGTGLRDICWLHSCVVPLVSIFEFLCISFLQFVVSGGSNLDALDLCDSV